MRVVLDAVVFVRALINPHSVWGRVLDRSGEYRLIVSLQVVGEILGVIQRPELSDRLFRISGVPQLEAMLELLHRAENVTTTQTDRVCRDPKDHKYFWCAAAGRADYIVSEDEDILAIPEYKGARTVRAADFLRILDAAAS